MWTWKDDIDAASDELDNFGYSYVIQNDDGEIRALCTTEEDAQKIVDALNKNNG